MSTDIQAVRFHDGERYCVALVKTGHKHLHAVVIDDCGVRVVSEPKEASRYTQPLVRKGAPYPLDRLVRHMRRIGRERGITAAAENILEEVLTKQAG
jgi:hypothetical protein